MSHAYRVVLTRNDAPSRTRSAAFRALPPPLVRLVLRALLRMHNAVTSGFGAPLFSTADAQRRVAQVGAFNDELQKAGTWVFAAGLHPARDF